MAKIGKKVDVDPFAAGKRAFGALDEALGALDGEVPAEVEPRSAPTTRVPPPTPESKKVERSAAKRPARALVESKREVAKPKAPSAPAKAEKRARRFLATDEEMRTRQSAAMRVGAATGARVDFSKMTRALWEVYLRHEEDILRNIPEGDGGWERPSNSDTVGLAELDERIATLLNDGLMVASRRPRNARNGE